jgi:hypothetical protein
MQPHIFAALKAFLCDLLTSYVWKVSDRRDFPTIAQGMEDDGFENELVGDCNENGSNNGDS